MRRRTIHRLIVLVGTITVLQNSVYAADTVSPRDASRLKQLRSQLFEKSHPATIVSKLLSDLRDAGKRQDVMKSIIEIGRKHQLLICRFADKSPDIEVREACAKIVRALDDDWRMTEFGREFESLCWANIAALLPQAWLDFEKDPTDLAASATILSVSPEVVWKWLGPPPAKPVRIPKPAQDRHRIYLLLRMRDRSPDEFVARHLPEFDPSSASKAFVFPVNSCFRSVGHVRLKQLEYDYAHGLFPSESGGGPPVSYSSQLINLVPESLFLFRYQSGPEFTRTTPQQMRFREIQYVRSMRRNFGKPAGPNPTSPAIDKRKPLVHDGFTKTTGGTQSRRIGIRETDDWLAPELDLNTAQRDGRLDSVVVPWWWKRYVSKTNAKRMKFSVRKPDETAPAEISHAEIIAIGPSGDAVIPPEPPPNAPSLIVLPPKLTGRPSPNHRLAAELVCDRLVEEIAATGKARIVDRTQLQTILNERSLQNAAGEPLDSFDAFVRLEVDKQQFEAQAKISVIDLSTGSEFDTRTFPWPFDESKIPSIRTLLNSAVAKIGETRKSAKTKRVTVRFRGTRAPKRLRLRKYARQLDHVFSESIKHNPHLLIVEHFEAGSAAEESLLLLMGLSRSPGGHEFTPQADITLELTLEERESSGVAFEQTPIEGRLLLQTTAAEVQTEVAVAKIGELDSKIAKPLWKKLSEWLDAVEPGSATRVIDDMAVRRKQAAQELAAIKTIDSTQSPLQQAIARRQHAETALKLDPTSLEATYELIMAYSQYVSADRTRADVKDVAFAGLSLAAEHAEEFLAYPTAMADVQSAANRLGFGAGIIRMSIGPDEDENRRNLQTAKNRLIVDETALSGPLTPMNAGSGFSLRVSLRHLVPLGEPLEKIQTRVARIIINIARLQVEFDATAQPYDSLDISDWRAQQQIAKKLRSTRQQILSACTDLQLRKQFDHLYPMVQADIKKEDYRKGMVSQLRHDVGRWKDSRLMDEFEDWVKTLADSPPVTLQYTTWPQLDVFAGTTPAVAKTQPIVVPLIGEEEVFPIARNSDRLFFVTGRSQFAGWSAGSTRAPKQRLGYVPIDQNGQPNGPVQFVPRRQESLDLQIRSYLATDSQLILGIGSWNERPGGLDILDLETNRWSHIGVDDGLPVGNVRSMHRLSNDRLLCVGIGRRSEYAYFTLDLNSHKIRLYGIGHSKQEQRFPKHLLAVVENNGKVYGLAEFGLWRNMLSSDPFRFQPGLEPKPKWINIYQGCALDSHFYYFYDGLHCISPSGKTVRSWTKQQAKGSGEVARKIGGGGLSLFPTVPNMHLMSCDNMLLFFERGGSQVVGFVPETNTWYGPVAIDRTSYALRDQSSVWLGGKTIRRLPLANVVTAAMECDRVFAPGDFRQQQLKAIANTSGLKRAKLEFGLQNFDVAGEHLSSFVKDNPTHTGGLFFGGILHDEWGLDEPDKAAEFYEQVAKVKTKPSMAFTAKYRHCLLLNRIGKPKQASVLAKKLLSDYPTITSSRIRENAQENLKAIAGGSSNRIGHD